MNIFDDNFLSDVYGIDDLLKNTDNATVQTLPLNQGDTASNPMKVEKFIGDKTEFLAKLKTDISACKRCELFSTRKNIVFGEGSVDSRLMFIGEGPGADEDESGRPFVGRAGQLLTKMIDAMGIKREDVFIANIVKCRPPNNRNPFEEEARSCIGFLEEQIRTIHPEIIVTLGSVASKYILGDLGNISSYRGKWCNYNGFKVMPTFHPAYLMRSPDKKKDAWADLKLVMKELGL